MHELSIATSVLESVQAEVAKYPNARCKRVGLKIGELAGIDADALTFSWEALNKDTDWEDVVLDVEFCPRRHRCPDCGALFDVRDLQIECPRCAKAETVFISGDELEIAYVEVDE